MPAIAIGVFTDRVLGPTGPLDADVLAADLESIDFDPKHGSIATLPGRDGFDRVHLVGLGDDLTTELLRQAAGALGRTASGEVLSLLGEIDVEEAERAAVEGFVLGAYRYTRYKSGDDAESPTLVAEDGSPIAIDPVMEAVAWTRDLVNEIPTDQPPAEVADRMVAIASELGLEVEVLGLDELREGGFGGVLAVNAGSEHPARLVELRYRPEGATAHLALVGKGIIFDTGGLSLKPATAMDWMKVDMAGAAAVLGAIQAIARLGLPVNVTAITPLTENMPGPTATKPGDVLTARNGKTIEVLNTDAEGRLILADGLSLATEREPDLIVDVATLTGACKVALGDGFAGLFGNDDGAIERVRAAADASGERVWPMPLPADYRPQIDSTMADMQNTGKTRYGGAITAALLLAEFVDDLPWAHLDIAGPAWATEASGYTHKGGTGYGVRTLVELARSLSTGY
ncbi:MAG: leucyl aminopeptidase [Acidimicrobiia bacterium]